MFKCDIFFQSGAVVETLKKKQRNAAEFLGSILHYAANSFQCFELVQQ